MDRNGFNHRRVQRYEVGALLPLTMRNGWVLDTGIQWSEGRAHWGEEGSTRVRRWYTLVMGGYTGVREQYTGAREGYTGVSGGSTRVRGG